MSAALSPQPVTPVLAGAMRMMDCGFHVQPCTVVIRPDGKKKVSGLREGWQAGGLTREQVLAGFALGANAYLVVCGPSGLVVADLDVRPGSPINGIASWGNNPLGGIVVRTQGGGLHSYYLNDFNIDCHRVQGMKGVDIRGIGGGVFGPGSLNGAYRIERWGPLTPWSALGLQVSIRKPKKTAEPENTVLDDFFDPGIPVEHAYARIRAQLDAVTAHAQTTWDGFRETLALGAAYEIGGYVGAGVLSYEDAYAALVQAIRHAGAEPDQDDVLWIEQGLDEGAEHPLKVCQPQRTAGGVTKPPKVSPTAAPRRLPLIPDEVWIARPWLAAIRDRARETDDCPDAVLGAALGCYAASVPHTVKILTGIKQPLGTSLLVGLVSPSGLGKSSAWGLARSELAPLDGADVFPLPSGEGIAEALMGWVENINPVDGKVIKERQQVKHNAVYYIDEGAALNAGMTRDGASVGATMRALFSDSLLGNTNASEDRRRIIPAGSYSLAVVVGYQETTVLPVIRDLASGMAQRFLWFSALPPAQMPSGVRSVPRLTLPAITGLQQHTELDGSIRYGLPVEPAITERLRREAAQLRQNIDITQPNPDSQQPALLAKLAGLFCLIEGRSLITTADWELAERLYIASCAVRDALIELATEQEASARKDRAAQAGEAELHRKQFPAAVQRVAGVVVRRVRRAYEEGQECKRRMLVMTVGRDRRYLEAALDLALSTQMILQDGDKFFPGASPSE
jgi:Bifunctional DNA primase/polymerase, N-terminal